MKLGKSVRTKRDYCLNCGELLDGVTSIVHDGAKEDIKPKPGDMTVCAYCRHLMIYDDDGKLREPTFTEIAEIANDPRVLAIKPVLKKVFR